jgi:hypothetical protein
LSRKKAEFVTDGDPLRIIMAQIKHILVVNYTKADIAKPSLPSEKIPREPWVLGYAARGIKKYPGLRRNLLGRNGWLNKLRFGLVEYESTVFLSRLT